jgi:hypothetical protein
MHRPAARAPNSPLMRPPVFVPKRRHLEMITFSCGANSIWPSGYPEPYSPGKPGFKSHPGHWDWDSICLSGRIEEITADTAAGEHVPPAAQRGVVCHRPPILGSNFFFFFFPCHFLSLGKVPSLLRTSCRTRIRIFFQKLNLTDINLIDVAVTWRVVPGGPIMWLTRVIRV